MFTQLYIVFQNCNTVYFLSQKVEADAKNT